MNPDISIREQSQALQSGKTTSVALTQSLLDRIAATNEQTHAFIRTDVEGALAGARQADAELAQGQVRSPLHGIPVGIKDIYDVAGQPTTCHSKVRLDHVAEEDSAPVQRLREAGAVLLGKLATHEFALGAPCDDLPFPPARNPWNLAHIPGGSSSGSGAAIAAGYTRVAMGSCTGGSIRIPAAWCGTVGLKPTFGRVSKFGVFPLAWSLDHCGPLTRSVDDAALTLQVLAGHDPRDPSSADVAVDDYTANLEDGVQGLRIGVPRHLFEQSPVASAEFLGAMAGTQAHLQEAGATLSDARLADAELFLACGRVIISAEMFAIHAHWLRERPLDYSEMTLPRLLPGMAVSSEDYLNALRLKHELAAGVNRALEHCDVLLTAVTLDTAPAFGPTGQFRFWPVQTYAFNVTGHPAISVPIGLSSQGLPMAVQVVGRYFDEAMVLRVARAIERLTGWENQALPNLGA